MAEQVTHLAASAGEACTASSERQRAYSDMPARRKGGLDTGARGWRWVVGNAAARHGHPGPAAR